jgi:hypothetical protein
MTAPLTSLTIGLFDARSADTSSRGGRLKRSLSDAGIDVRVMTFDSVAPDLDISGFDAIFLTGLQSSDNADLPSQAADNALRAALCKAEIAYQVIYGSDEESLAQMMSAIENLISAGPTTAVLSNQKPRSNDGTAPWIWVCDKCSDPLCEHRLLSDLLEQRQKPTFV